MLPPRYRRLAAGVLAVASFAPFSGCLDWDVGPFEAAQVDGGADARAPATPPDPPTEGLVAHWTFDEGAGEVANDSSGRGHHAVLVGAPVWTSGKYGGALAFDGADRYVAAPSLDDAAFPVRGTLSLWVESAFEGDFRPVFDNVVAERAHLSLRNHVAGKLQFNGRTADGGLAFNGIIDVVPPGSWFHLVLVWDAPARRASAYRDGVPVFSSATLPAGWLPSAQEVSFARKPGGGGFVGKLDDVRLYDRPLSPEEIARLP